MCVEDGRCQIIPGQCQLVCSEAFSVPWEDDVMQHSTSCVFPCTQCMDYICRCVSKEAVSAEKIYLDWRLLSQWRPRLVQIWKCKWWRPFFTFKYLLWARLVPKVHINKVLQVKCIQEKNCQELLMESRHWSLKKSQWYKSRSSFPVFIYLIYPCQGLLGKYWGHVVAHLNKDTLYFENVGKWFQEAWRQSLHGWKHWEV